MGSLLKLLGCSSEKIQKECKIKFNYSTVGGWAKTHIRTHTSSYLIIPYNRLA